MPRDVDRLVSAIASGGRFTIAVPGARDPSKGTWKSRVRLPPRRCPLRSSVVERQIENLGRAGCP